MKQRTYILRVWRDAGNALTLQVMDLLRGEQARVFTAQELWNWLEACFQVHEHSLAFPMLPQEKEQNDSAW